MSSYSLKTYRLEKNEFNYLLPVLHKKLLEKGDSNTYYFCGDGDDLDDMLSRLKGLYNYYHDYNQIINYKCFKNSNLDEFRNEMKMVS